MPHAGTAKWRRQRLGLLPAKPGPIGWVHGTKVEFMESYKEDFIRVMEIGKVEAGKFYDDVARDYLAKYGYNTPWNGDLKEGADIASDVDEDEDIDSLAPVEAEARSKYFNTVRTKAAFWLRGKYGGAVTTNKKSFCTFRQLFDRKELDPPAPPQFEEKWAAHMSLHSPGQKLPAKITVQNEAIKESWLVESEAFKNEVLEALNKEHNAKVKMHKTVVESETLATPESYQIALDNAGYYLEPFVNAITQHFGMNVSLMLYYDRAGFEATRQSFRRFSEECFTTVDRLARSLNGMPEMQSGEDTSLRWGSAGGPMNDGGNEGGGGDDDDDDGAGGGDNGDKGEGGEEEEEGGGGDEEGEGAGSDEDEEGGGRRRGGG
ncbi:hypothetical protein B0H14DRAFT_3438511 [Mycena olivaceomarginata]|nr:hypothetical protein B0H14DRAFT_3438511 [Mycena olivaceomarginata]